MVVVVNWCASIQRKSRGYSTRREHEATRGRLDMEMAAIRKFGKARNSSHKVD